MAFQLNGQSPIMQLNIPDGSMLSFSFQGTSGFNNMKSQQRA
jgi:hypothetical protein